MRLVLLAAALAASVSGSAIAAPKIVQNDYLIDSVDAGIRLAVRSKMAEGQKEFTDDNIVNHGYVVYMLDKRNYGGSTREKAMEEPAANNKPVSRSYQVIRDLGAVVDHIAKKHHVSKVTLIGWSWGAMTSGYYTSLHSEKVQKLVLYAPLYSYTRHTNLGAGSGLQDKRNPANFNPAMGAYR